MKFNAFIAGFPLGSEVKKVGDTAQSNVVGIGGPVTGEFGTRGVVEVDQILRLKGTWNTTVVQGDYVFYPTNPLGGVYSGFNPDVATVFATEIQRLGYFAPLLQENLTIQQVLNATGAAPSAQSALKKITVPSKSQIKSVRASVPANQLFEKPFKFYNGIIVGNPLEGIGDVVQIEMSGRASQWVRPAPLRSRTRAWVV